MIWKRTVALETIESAGVLLWIPPSWVAKYQYDTTTSVRNWEPNVRIQLKRGAILHSES